MRRPLIFIAALVAGFTYWVADHQIATSTLHTLWKGLGVGLLALWAGSVARERNGWLLAAVLALGATGDVLLEAVGVVAGAATFLAGHLVAIVLYLRNRRPASSLSQRLCAAMLLIVTPLVGWLLTRDAAVAAYATGLGGMAAAAWLSRFPRDRVGLGAVLFVASDWLIFARAGPLASSGLPDLLVWPTYFGGQALIAWGVATTLERRA